MNQASEQQREQAHEQMQDRALEEYMSEVERQKLIENIFYAVDGWSSRQYNT